MFIVGYNNKLLTYEYVSDKLAWIEEICLDLLNYSLQIPFIPVKKCVFLFWVYLQVVFENDPNRNENNLDYGKGLKFITETSVNQMMKAPPRSSLKLQSQVEKFYVIFYFSLLISKFHFLGKTYQKYSR